MKLEDVRPGLRVIIRRDSLNLRGTPQGLPLLTAILTGEIRRRNPRYPLTEARISYPNGKEEWKTLTRLEPWKH